MKPGRKATAKWWTGNIRGKDVGINLRLTPLWERGITNTGRKEIIIDPGPSFGAGDHPTTIMALEFLENVMNTIPKPRSILDVGTGTGVLAVAARILGCETIVAHDIDPSAVVTTRRNFVLNDIENKSEDSLLFVGEGVAVKGRFDVVAANLAAPTLLRLKDELCSKVRRYLILSGIAEPLINAVVESYSENLEITDRCSRDEWNAAIFCRR